MLARTQGKFPIASSFGERAIGTDGNPLSDTLWIDKLDGYGNTVMRVTADNERVAERVPLVRVGYRHPGSGRLINTRDGWPSVKEYQKESYYMVIDVTNAVRDPRLGAGNNDVEFRKRLQALAEMLVIAADWNGEVYWRHLTTFLETQKAAQATGKAAIGAAIAGSFISPVLGASLAGAALVTDTFIEEFTSSLNVDEYAKLRDAATTHRKVKRDELFNAVNSSGEDQDKLNRILQLANDYAFTYSIKGALQSVSKTEAEMREYLITGESSWRVYFQDEIDRYQIQRLDRGEIPAGSTEHARLTNLKAERERRSSDVRASEEKIRSEERLRRVAEAEIQRLKAEQELHEQRMLTLQMRQEADRLERDAEGDRTTGETQGE